METTQSDTLEKVTREWLDGYVQEDTRDQSITFEVTEDNYIMMHQDWEWVMLDPITPVEFKMLCQVIGIRLIPKKREE